MQMYDFFCKGALLRKIMLGEGNNLARFAVYLH